MIRQKVILGDYIYVVDLYKAGVDLKNPTYKSFYILRDLDVINNVTSNRHIYFIEKNTYKNNKIIYPLNEVTSVGYSTDVSKFNSNITNDVLNDNLYHLYRKSNDEYKETEILCDMIRIYFPTIKNKLDAIIDVENFINDIKIHYLINDINNYERNSKNEMTIDHQSYSEFIDIYIPSLDSLLYDDSICIEEYDIWCDDSVYEDTNDLDSSIVNEDHYIPFNVLYYPYKILSKKNADETVTYFKSYVKNSTFINNQFYSTLNLIMYPYKDIDTTNIFVMDNDLTPNATTFNVDLEIKLSTELRFTLPGDFDTPEEYDTYYGVPCAVSTFNINPVLGSSLEDRYLVLNGLTADDYTDYDKDDIDSLNHKDMDDEYFGEDYWEIEKTGFRVEMATDRHFSNIFFTYNINSEDKIIDNFIFPLTDIFSTWNDIPELIIYRVTFVDKVACYKLTSNPVIITSEWFKYLIEKEMKHKLHFNKVYKKVNDNMLVGQYNSNETPVLFIDKINCNIVKSQTEEEQGINITKKNSPKIIYKPVFYKVGELQTINIRAGVVQNIGVNLDEYMTKVETFKLVIEDLEFVEYGRNNIYVIFNINGNKLKEKSGKYIITNENDEYISDGTYYIS